VKLLVLGATGGTGLQVVSQAIERGHSVTAFVRNPSLLNGFSKHLRIIKGDSLSCAELERAAANQDAVLSGFGPRVPKSKVDGSLMQDFATALTKAMRRAGARRVVVVSMAFLFKDSLIPPAYLLGRLFFPRIVADAEKMERVIADSGLDWTIVRPPRLTDKPMTRKYRVRKGHLPRFGFTISRADTADFLLRAADDRETVQKIIGVCN